MVIFVLITWVLIRKRNTLHSRFRNPEGIRRVIDIGGGMKIALVEIDGHRIACAIGKTGVTAMQIISAAERAEHQ